MTEETTNLASAAQYTAPTETKSNSYTTDEIIHLRFLIDPEHRKKRLKWKDLKAIQKMQQGEAVDLEKIQVIAARFMVDENHNYLPFEQAYAIFDDLTEEESSDALKQFTDAMSV